MRHQREKMGNKLCESTNLLELATFGFGNDIAKAQNGEPKACLVTQATISTRQVQGKLFDQEVA